MPSVLASVDCGQAVSACTPKRPAKLIFILTATMNLVVYVPNLYTNLNEILIVIFQIGSTKPTSTSSLPLPLPLLHFKI